MLLMLKRWSTIGKELLLETSSHGILVTSQFSIDLSRTVILDWLPVAKRPIKIYIASMQLDCVYHVFSDGTAFQFFFAWEERWVSGELNLLQINFHLWAMKMTVFTSQTTTLSPTVKSVVSPKKREDDTLDKPLSKSIPI